MIKNNPGCILPFYPRTIWQRHRQHGQSELPYGMKAPNARLLPFQIRGASGTASTVTWQLVNAVDESETIAQTTSLVVNNVSGGGWYVTWFANTDISNIPDCGYYYIVVFVNSVPHYSEVLHLDGVSSEEIVSLSLDACDTGSSGTIFGVNAADTLSGTIDTQEIAYFGGGTWQVIGAGSGNITWNDPGPIQVYRRVRLTSGRVITAYGEITFTDENDPCADAAISMESQTSVNDPELWRVRFAFGGDRGGVLYQTGWQQWFYLPERPTFAIPAFEIDEDAKTDGFGVEKNVATSIVERLPFEFFEMPDYAAQGIIECCYACDFGLLEETITAFAYQLNAPRYTATSESIGGSKGQITSIISQVTITCQDNKTLL